MLTREEMHELGVKALETLKIYKPYVTAFKKNGTVTLFENFGGFWATPENGEEELYEKIKAFEEESGHLVYAVTHELTEFGELYNFLFISKYEEDNTNDTFEDLKDGYAFAYVWNKDNDDCSEYGSIGIESRFGGIRRTA